jgi:hypothetical protein
MISKFSENFSFVSRIRRSFAECGDKIRDRHSGASRESVVANRGLSIKE